MPSREPEAASERPKTDRDEVGAGTMSPQDLEEGQPLPCLESLAGWFPSRAVFFPGGLILFGLFVPMIWTGILR